MVKSICIAIVCVLVIIFIYNIIDRLITAFCYSKLLNTVGTPQELEDKSAAIITAAEKLVDKTEELMKKTEEIMAKSAGREEAPKKKATTKKATTTKTTTRKTATKKETTKKEDK